MTLERKTCSDCHRVYYSWGAHMEECAGPPQRIAPTSPPDPGSKCDCNNGGMHEPDCEQVTA